MKLFRLTLALCLCTAVTTVAYAQLGGDVPKRPFAKEIADTNDAKAYYEMAMKNFEQDPAGSAAGFYWASRLDPTSADALDGRRAALILGKKHLLAVYLTASTSSRETSRELRALDSLRLKALMLDPFLYQKLEKRLLMAYYHDGETATNEGTDGEWSIYLASQMKNWSAVRRAEYEYDEGDFDEAIKQYREGMDEASNKAPYHLVIARILGNVGKTGDALNEFKLALDEMRKKDAKKVVVLYDSKAMAELSVGILLDGAGRQSEAREAYGRALQEDLSFYPAHVKLGMLAGVVRDSTAAISEFELATTLAPKDGYIRYQYALMLGSLAKHTEAIAQMTKAIELEPYFAESYYVLAKMQEAKGDAAGARVSYAAFIKHAAKSDGRRADAESHLAPGSDAGEAAR